MSALKIVSDGSTNWPPSLPKSQPTSKMAAATKKRNLFKLKQDELKLQFYANELFDIFGVFHEICNFDNFLLRMQIRPIFFFTKYSFENLLWKHLSNMIQTWPESSLWYVSDDPANQSTWLLLQEIVNIGSFWHFLFIVYVNQTSDTDLWEPVV